MEGRLLVVTKDLAINLAKQSSLYKELKEFQLSNSDLIKEN